MWILDPGARRGYMYTSDGGHEAKDGILRTNDPVIEVRLGEIFS